MITIFFLFDFSSIVACSHRFSIATLSTRSAGKAINITGRVRRVTSGQEPYGNGCRRLETRPRGSKEFRDTAWRRLENPPSALVA